MLKKIKNIKSIDLIYISILFFITIVVIILFFMAVKSITLNINKIFIQQENNNIQVLNKDRYSLLEKKLNINSNEENIKNGNGDTLNDSYVSNNNGLISIKIINATNTNGAAKKLSQELVSLGFTDPTTETSNQQLPNTTIAIKETAQEYKDVLKGLVSKTYPKAFFTTNDINSEFDVIITIGFK